MLFSFESLLPASNALGTSVQTSLKAADPGRMEIFTEFLDADRFPGPKHESRMAALLREKYATVEFALAIAIGPPALDFLIGHRASLLSGTPLIFTGLSEASFRERTLPPDITGIVSRFDPVPTLDLALRLQPDAQQVVVVTGASTFDEHWEVVARDRFRHYADRLQVDYLSGLPLPQLFSELATAARSRVSSANDSGKSKFARIALGSGRNGN